MSTLSTRAAGVSAPAPRTASPSDRLRMRDLCEQTGLNRQAIHFYIREGLVPPGQKTSRNMAWYTPAHVERILQIKKLQHERFLPLHAIKALLDERDERFDDDQRSFLRQLRTRLRLEEAADAGRDAVLVDDLVDAGHIERADIERLHAAGLSGIGTDSEGRMVVTGEAVPIVEVLGRLRQLGFTEQAGVAAEDVLLYERAVTELLREEAQIVARSFQSLPADDAAARISDALPLIHELIARLHRARIQEFLDAF